MLPGETSLNRKSYCERGVGERWRHLGGMAKVTEDDGGVWKPRISDDFILWTFPKNLFFHEFRQHFPVFELIPPIWNIHSYSHIIFSLLWLSKYLGILKKIYSSVFGITFTILPQNTILPQKNCQEKSNLRNARERFLHEKVLYPLFSLT